MPKTRGLSFYAEMVVATTLSYSAASIWIEWFRKAVAKNGEPNVLFVWALLLTLLAITVLYVLFSNDKNDTDKK